MIKVILHLGSNKADRVNFVSKAIKLVDERVGNVVRKSKIYETEPWGEKNQPMYINQSVVCKTNLGPDELLAATQSIEAELGKDLEYKWGPRNIDIDILTFGDKKIDRKDLTIPHPRISERNFVLIPLMEIEPDLVLPGMNQTIEELYEDSRDECEVYLLDGE